MSNVFICQGAPGSGKSTLAKEFAAKFNAVICSADDFHMKNGKYCWKPENSGKGHKYCQELAKKNIEAGVDVVIDNTNTTTKEMNFYIDVARIHNAKIYIVRPDTEWALNVNELFIRNTHGVPMKTIEAMIDRIRLFMMVEKEYDSFGSNKPRLYHGDIQVITKVEEVENVRTVAR